MMFLRTRYILSVKFLTVSETEVAGDFMVTEETRVHLSVPGTTHVVEKCGESK